MKQRFLFLVVLIINLQFRTLSGTTTDWATMPVQLQMSKKLAMHGQKPQTSRALKKEERARAPSLIMDETVPQAMLYKETHPENNISTPTEKKPRPTETENTDKPTSSSLSIVPSAMATSVLLAIIGLLYGMAILLRGYTKKQYTPKNKARDSKPPREKPPSTTQQTLLRKLKTSSSNTKKTIETHILQRKAGKNGLKDLNGTQPQNLKTGKVTRVPSRQQISSGVQRMARFFSSRAIRIAEREHETPEKIKKGNISPGESLHHPSKPPLPPMHSRRSPKKRRRNLAVTTSHRPSYGPMVNHFTERMSQKKEAKKRKEPHTKQADAQELLRENARGRGVENQESSQQLSGAQREKALSAYRKTSKKND